MCHQLSLDRKINHTRVEQRMPMAGGLRSGKEVARMRKSNLGSCVEEVDADLNVEHISVLTTERLRRLRFLELTRRLLYSLCLQCLITISIDNSTNTYQPWCFTVTNRF